MNRPLALISCAGLALVSAIAVLSREDAPADPTNRGVGPLSEDAAGSLPDGEPLEVDPLRMAEGIAERVEPQESLAGRSPDAERQSIDAAVDSPALRAFLDRLNEARLDEFDLEGLEALRAELKLIQADLRFDFVTALGPEEDLLDPTEHEESRRWLDLDTIYLPCSRPGLEGAAAAAYVRVDGVRGGDLYVARDAARLIRSVGPYRQSLLDSIDRYMQSPIVTSAVDAGVEMVLKSDLSKAVWFDAEGDVVAYWADSAAF
ncbi:hypothetical protein Pla86_09130 [Planctomycetes bacterium Pla86]|uniref:Uncharacterized protein n=1 Tax=Engelhardtia mirabilis TaxID=2528011 RepID=A0A518BFU5_9BACT|nr:hypothetical protein Pla133_09140 [Planctomycetes bacterium Pla133]QDV00174.1 hypothetical protein Pla86_09130 [Planctomycetes bacterium Pla86]